MNGIRRLPRHASVNWGSGENGWPHADELALAASVVDVLGRRAAAGHRTMIQARANLACDRRGRLPRLPSL
jgi:hypothetical protein